MRYVTYRVGAKSTTVFRDMDVDQAYLPSLQILYSHNQ
jgi:hypothetical protein